MSSGALGSNTLLTVYSEKRFDIKLQKKDSEYNLVLGNKENLIGKDKKVLCRFKSFDDPQFQNLMTRLSAYTGSELPEVSAFRARSSDL